VDGGRALRLNTGDVVRISRSKFTTRLVHLTERNFFDIVKTKFK
jgi:NAD kinase